MHTLTSARSFLLVLTNKPTKLLLFLLLPHNTFTYVDDATLYSRLDKAFGLCQQLELALELELHLRVTMD